LKKLISFHVACDDGLIGGAPRPEFNLHRPHQKRVTVRSRLRHKAARAGIEGRDCDSERGDLAFPEGVLLAGSAKNRQDGPVHGPLDASVDVL
jgi:hypothetical protein